MKDRSVFVIVAVMVLGVIALATGFKEVPSENHPWYNIHFGDEASDGTDSSQAEHRVVDAGEARAVRVTLEQALGELNVSGSTPKVMDATFDTRPKSWLPAVDYSVEGTQGILSVRQPEDGAHGVGETRNTWTIALSDSLPIDLTVERGVGEGTLDFSDVDLTRLRAVLGLGETTIDLSGERTHDLDARIESGVGDCTLIVPADTAVRIVAEKGIGDLSAEGFTRTGSEYTNAAYPQGGPLMTVHITQGIGEITIRTAE